MAGYRFSKEAKQDLKNIYKQGVVQYGKAQADIYFEALQQDLVKFQINHIYIQKWGIFLKDIVVVFVGAIQFIIG